MTQWHLFRLYFVWEINHWRSITFWNFSFAKKKIWKPLVVPARPLKATWINEQRYGTAHFMKNIMAEILFDLLAGQYRIEGPTLREVTSMGVRKQCRLEWVSNMTSLILYTSRSSPHEGQTRTQKNHWWWKNFTLASLLYFFLVLWPFLYFRRGKRELLAAVCTQIRRSNESSVIGKGNKIAFSSV